MTRHLLTLALLTLAMPAAAQGGGTCRPFMLVDNDSGEQVEGCVPERVRDLGGKPVAVIPALQNGVRFGWKVAELGRGELLARMGLRPGDVILTCNGYDMASQEKPDKIVEVLAGDEKLVLTVGQKPRLAASPTGTQVQVIELTKTNQGITLGTIPPGSLWAKLGLLPGDTVVSVAGTPATDPLALDALAQRAQSLPEALVVVRRQGKELNFLVKTQ